MNLLHITDLHLYADETKAHRGVVTADSLRAVLSAALSEQSAPDAIIITGDLCQDESAGGYQLLRRILEEIDLPIYCLPGNHDDLAFMQSELAGGHIQVLGEAMLGDWRLLMLDCSVTGEVHGEFGPDRLQALQEMLSEQRDAPTLIAFHHPPVVAGSAWLDGSRLRDADALMQVLAHTPQVRGILCGHIHQVVDVNVTPGEQPIRVMTTPATSRQFASNSDEFATSDEAAGWRTLSLGETTFQSRVDRLSDQAMAATTIKE